MAPPASRTALDTPVRARRGGGARGHQHHHPVGPPRRRRAHSDAVAARLRGRASSSDPPGPAHLGRARGRVGRAARGASLRLPRRLRRRGDQSLSRLRDADRDAGRPAAEARREGNRQALHQVDRQGPAQGDVQDGHLHLSVLLRRADFRRGRPASRISSANISPAPPPASKASAWPRSRRRRCGATATPSAMRRSIATALDVGGEYAVARARRGSRLDRARRCRRCSTRCAATCRTSTAPSPSVSTSSPSGCSPSAACSGSSRREDDGRKPVPIEEVEPAKNIVQALRDRRHVVRLDLARGAYHARHRHEPHRRQVEHRRRRRGGRPLQAAAERRFHALGDQAGRLRPLRRHRGISRQLRHDADQDGAGRQARRRRPVARPQGRQDHRQGAPFDARRRPDLAAAAPRHLFDRGSRAAHLRPEERQSRRPTCR